MGADLICYLAVGPVKLNASAKRKKAALAQAKRIISELKKARELNEKYEKATDDKARRALSLEASKLKIVQEGMPKVAAKNFFSLKFGTGGNEFLDENEWIAGLNPEQVLKDFLDIWHHRERCRDCSYRPLPGNEKYQVLVAGEMSWGDEPDGWGFQTLKAAGGLGYLKYFGVD